MYDEVWNFLKEACRRLSKDSIDSLKYLPMIGKDTDGASTYWDLIDDVRAELGAKECKCGASKMTFLFKEFPDVVVKVSTIGWRLYEDEDDDGAVHELNPVNGRTDFCGLESDIYQDAADKGLDEFFFDIAEVFSFEGVKFYVEEKFKKEYWDSKEYLDGDYKKGSKDSKARVKKINDSTSKVIDIDNNIISTWCEYYDIDILIRLMQFLEEWNINDLHVANVAFDKAGNLRIFDYSGYKGVNDDCDAWKSLFNKYV